MVLTKDWEHFYRVTAGRPTRPLFDHALEAWGQAPPGVAADLGAGDGTETVALLAGGWAVFSIDAEPAHGELLAERVPPDARHRLTVRTAAIEAVALEPVDLVYAGYSLPFITPAAFDATWARIRTALRPGGLLAVHLFGPRDTWHDDPDMTFTDRDRVTDLVDGLDVLELTETDEDGPSAVGPKHWHLFEVLAGKPSVAG